MLYNRQSFADHDGIRQAHGYIGFAGNGAFSGLHDVTDQEHFTDDEIVVEGRLCGKHVGEFGGFAPTDQRCRAALRRLLSLRRLGEAHIGARRHEPRSPRAPPNVAAALGPDHSRSSRRNTRTQ